MERKFIILKYRDNIIGKMFEYCDFKNKDVTIMSTVRNTNNIFLKVIRRIHLSKKVNKIIDLPFKHIWGSTFGNIINDTNVEYYVIFTNVSIFPINPSYLSEIQKKYNVHYIFYFYDPVSPTIHSVLIRKYWINLKFDYIFTFDPSDAAKYNYIHYYIPYSMISDNECNDVNNDLYLAASNHGLRLYTFYKLYSYFKDQGIKMLFRIVGVSKKEQKYKNDIIYNEKIEYSEAVNELKKSNCILEVVSAGQSGATLRYYEAVCYNKKLLTTNKNVVNLPFYDPRYMKVFEKPEDIDIEWIKRREEIDYHYDGRFSPTHLIDKIIELEEEKKKEG